MPIFNCSYAANQPSYADFTFRAKDEATAQRKLEAMLRRGCFDDVMLDPCYENAPEDERVFISGRTKKDDQPLARLENFNPQANRQPGPQPYTVILLYPDHCTDTYGETWCGHVTALNPAAALAEARRQCITDNQFDADTDPDDFAVVSIFAGQHHDLR